MKYLYFTFTLFIPIIFSAQKIDKNNFNYSVEEIRKKTGKLFGSDFNDYVIDIKVKTPDGDVTKYSFSQHFIQINPYKNTYEYQVHGNNIKYDFNIDRVYTAGGVAWKNEASKDDKLFYLKANEKDTSDYLLELFTNWHQLNYDFLPKSTEKLIISKKKIHVFHRKYEPGDKIKAFKLKGNDTIFTDPQLLKINDTTIQMSFFTYTMRISKEKGKLKELDKRLININDVQYFQYDRNDKVLNTVVGVTGGILVIASPIVFITGGIISIVKASKKEPAKNGLIVMGVGVGQFIAGVTAGMATTKKVTYWTKKYDYKLIQ